MKRLSRDEIAQRLARDIPEGAFVNLGIGLPTKVANYLPEDKEIFLQSENGVLGMGPAPAKGEEDWNLINAGKQPVTLLKGGSYFPKTRFFFLRLHSSNSMWQWATR
jgi:3-oxoadipate CoA-transferase beta subunit